MMSDLCHQGPVPLERSQSLRHVLDRQTRSLRSSLSLDLIMSVRPRLARSLLTPSTSRRTIWTTSTHLSSSPTSLLSHLQQLPAPSSPPSAILYALSKNVPYELLHSIQLSLTPSPSTPSLGVLSELLPSSFAPSLSLGSNGEVYSVSIASYTPSGGERAIPFRSNLTGRANASVGREHKLDSSSSASSSGGEEGVDVGFEAFLSGKKWGFGDSMNLMEGKRAKIQELEGVR